MDKSTVSERINSLEQLGGGQSHSNKLIILVLVLAIVYFVYKLFFSSGKTKKNNHYTADRPSLSITTAMPYWLVLHDTTSARSSQCDALVYFCVESQNLHLYRIDLFSILSSVQLKNLVAQANSHID